MTRHRQPTSLRAASAWFAFAYGGAIVGYLALNAIAARMLGDTFGYFVIAVTVATLLGQLGLVGVHRGGLREAARLDPQDKETLRELRADVRAVSSTVLPVTSLATAAVTFGVLHQTDLVTRGVEAVSMGLLVWFSGQQKLWANYLRGFGFVRFASLLEGRSGGALASVCQAAILALIAVTLPGSGLAGALTALVIGYALPVTIAWRRVAALWRHVPSTGSVWRGTARAVRRHWRFASNLLGGFLNSTVELWLAALVLSSLDVSLFSASQRLAVLLTIPLNSLGIVFSPVVSRLSGNDDRRLEKVLRTGASCAAAVTAVAWLPLLVFPGPVLSAVYGDAFAAAAPMLLLLTIGNIGNVVSGLCGTALTMSRHETVVATVQWVAVVVRLGLGVLVAGPFGAVGLACSAAVVTLGLYACLWLFAKRRMGLNTFLTLRPSLRALRDTAG